eukprot:4049990-Pyramimonas_sp.AAC.1
MPGQSARRADVPCGRPGTRSTSPLLVPPSHGGVPKAHPRGVALDPRTAGYAGQGIAAESATLSKPM